ncbi:hypothetical protein Lbir_0023 [Legionella birminghamensis]|uniref:Dot/Icm secretion system substrate n=1 Tax=Legionella birminghamensis TaxID=28083 RepID=A0A378IBA1_9GAMM|nr:hypothetical protein [Legionella birminghamensis]KTC75954.1 hypothetical protein Lbir_0023 [Legionella birminghamensis]STX32080.1 Uncharacterised protein [Legionella birminghamensis]
MNLTEEDAEKLQRQLIKLLEQYIERMQKASKDLLASSPFEVMARTQTANEAAYKGYLDIHQQNNAKSDEAFKAYNETCDRNNAESRAAFDSYRAGEMSYEDALAIKEKNDLANSKAYDFACSIKDQNDSASMKAYDEYRNAFDANNKTCDQVIRNANSFALADTVAKNADMTKDLESAMAENESSSDMKTAESSVEESPEENASTSLR